MCKKGGAPVAGPCAAVDGNGLGEPLPVGMSLTLVMLLVGLNGFLVAAQHAMSKARMNRIERLTAGKGAHAGRARRMLERNGYATACQLGITGASIGIGWLGSNLAAGRAAPWLTDAMGISPALAIWSSIALVFVPLVLLHVTIGALVPRAAAHRKAELAAIRAARPLHLLYLSLWPLVWLAHHSTSAMLKLAGLAPATEKEPAHTEEDLRNLLKESHRSGFIDQTELTLVDNIFDFTETTAREIMIPRTEMICLHAGLSLQANKTIAVQYMRTRYPVCETDKDDIIGFVHMKDLFSFSTGMVESIREVMRPVTSVPDSLPISVLLKLMQRNKTQLVILIDEYGGTSGLVTLEDIMEEIVGDIQDEFDPEHAAIVRQEDGSCLVSGSMLIEEMNSFFGMNLESGDYDTIGGWLYSQLPFPPAKGHSVSNDDGRFQLIVEEMQHLRILRIRIIDMAGDIQRTIKKGLNGSV
ncbi:HlyC/CorC family transporter [Paenibacillus sp. 1011MAR3C5]|uniref:hemolysin family protein n=1 Tax=Paenibacillus sp. 1011MAR3C5 TaxID=1675787 RepID=UPI000E6B7A72|nr:hemolysin family protein [Paenibacillus sp. 1011MAR3C5]RJE91000.1 HlyC/CorC family transporter [Paenibacillus sp. 1011MAR3C5]